MHILYNIAGFYRPAGMERVLADKANWLVAHGHRVTILTTEQKERPNAFPLDSRINMRDLAIGYEDNNGGSLWNKLMHYPGKQRRHRRMLETTLRELKPDITISMFCNEVNLVPRLKDGSHKLLEVHFSRFKRLQYNRTGLWAIVDRWRSRKDEMIIRKYERFIVLTEEDRLNWGGAPHIQVIKNPVHFHSTAPSALDSKTVIAVGRYTHQKGLERLIEAWSIICSKLGKNSGWTLNLIGDGELREDLQKQINRLAIADSVVLGRNESDMERVYRSAAIVALPSRYEGLPMALLEAQSFGVPAVAFDCQCGPKEIISDGKDGLLVPEGDVEGLADGLLKLMTDDRLRKDMGLAAWKNSVRWEIGPIMEQWIKVFEEILSSRQ